MRELLFFVSHILYSCKFHILFIMKKIILYNHEHKSKRSEPCKILMFYACVVFIFQTFSFSFSSDYHNPLHTAPYQDGRRHFNRGSEFIKFSS